MSEFFDDVSKALKRAANTVSTGVSIAAQEQRVKETYESIGRLYCQVVGEGKEPTGEAFDSQVVKVNDLLEKIKKIKEDQKVDL